MLNGNRYPHSSAVEYRRSLRVLRGERLVSGDRVVVRVVARSLPLPLALRSFRRGRFSGFSAVLRCTFLQEQPLPFFTFFAVPLFSVGSKLLDLLLGYCLSIAWPLEAMKWEIVRKAPDRKGLRHKQAAEVIAKQ